MKTIYKMLNNRRWVWVAILLYVTFTLAGCTESTVSDDKARGIFYEVSGGVNTVYLLGSIHVGEEEMYPLHSSVEEAFEASDVLVMEIDLDNLNEVAVAQEMMEYAMYTDGRTMRDEISEETFQSLLTYAEPLGIGEEVLDLFRPWYGTMLLTEIAVEQSGLSQEYGVEQYFLDQKGDREVVGLESVRDQLFPFTLLSSESQALYLEETLAEMDEVESQLREMIDYWIKGDFEYFENLRRDSIAEVATESLQQYQIAMLDGRDEVMTEKIQELLENDKEKTYFIVVGSLHLVGENGIPYNLEGLGYQLELGY